MAHILIVDDERSLRELLSAILEQMGHTCDLARDGVEGRQKVFARQYDLILTDVRMPNMSGIQFLEQIEHRVEGHTPCIIITALAHDPAVAVRAVRLACDFLSKPFEVAQVQDAVRRALALRDAWKARENQERALHMRLREKEAELEETYDGVVLGFAAMLEGKDGGQDEEDERRKIEMGTRRHCERLRKTATIVGRRMGLDREELRRLQLGAMLHDVGKFRIPDKILWKKGPLDEEEWVQMRRHPEYGAEFVRRIPFLADAVDVILNHHERYDGTGYPRALRSDEIPRVARIFSVVDAFDAMTHDRCYQNGRPPEFALDQILRGSGTQFDPEVVEAFEDTFDDLCRASGIRRAREPRRGEIPAPSTPRVGRIAPA